MNTYVAGVDGGGSKTEALLLNIESGQSVSVVAGGINSIVEGYDVSSAHLDELIAKMQVVLGESSGNLRSICIGSASIIDESQEHWSIKRIAEAFPQAKLLGVEDCRIALEGALEGKPGMIIVAGTGSMAYSVAPDGSINHCGGFGPLFGDEGSGYDIGREALRAVAMALDGRGAHTLLTEKLQEHIGFKSDTQLIDRVYGNYGRKEIAALTRIVGACAEQNDAVALGILHTAAGHLSAHLQALLRQTKWSEPPLLSYAGGVFQLGDLIVEPFREHLGEWASQLNPPANRPAYGAAMLAIKAIE